ncbi:MAG: hypothetical protein ABH817_00595 [archaeon]
MKKRKLDLIFESIFMIFLIISMPLAFSILISPNASAEEPDPPEENRGCCEVSDQGGKCLITTEEDCDKERGQFEKGIACDGTDFCNTGCCVGKYGICSPNSLLKDCGSGEFYTKDPSCGTVEGCDQISCCVIGKESLLTTNKYCTLNRGVWYPGITTQLACDKQVVETQGEVCCELLDTCVMTERTKCENSLNGLPHPKKCFDVAECDCKFETFDTIGICIPGLPHVYKKDNCGNVYPDEIEKTCTDSQFCEDGTCIEDKCFGTDVRYEAWMLDETGNNLVYKEIGERNHGESWCMFDTGVDLTNGMVPKGAYSRRAYCWHGEIKIEPCDVYRNTVCVENKNFCAIKESITNPTTQQLLDCSRSANQEDCNQNHCEWIEKTLTNARCMSNLGNTCIGLTKKEDCEQASPQCFWWEQLPVGNVNGKNWIEHYKNFLEGDGLMAFTKLNPDGEGQQPICLPVYPIAQEDGPNADTACALGSKVCRWAEALWGISRENPECDDPAWFSGMAHRCRALGDCGTYKNYVNEKTSGLVMGLAKEVPEQGEEIRITEEIPLPEDYLDFQAIDIGNIPGNQISGGEFILRTFIGLGTGALLVLGFDALWTSASWFAAGQGFSTITIGASLAGTSGGSVTVAAATGALAISFAAIAGGIALFMLAQTMGVGPGRGAIEALGAGLISGGTAFLMGGGWSGAGIIAAAGILLYFAIYLLTYKEKFYFVQCLPSASPIGGSDCEICDSDPNRPCNKYSCKSLGQACEWNDKIMMPNQYGEMIEVPMDDPASSCQSTTNTGTPPKIISAKAKDYLGTNLEVTYSEGYPPRTIKINDEISPLDLTTIEIEIDKKGFCWYDFVSRPYIENYNLVFSPSLEKKKIAQIPFNEQQKTWFIRCVDTHGNVNGAEYRLIADNIKEGPDLTAPRILRTKPTSPATFLPGLTELDVGIWLNEEATCRWTASPDKQYGDMNEETEKNTIDSGTGSWYTILHLTGLIPDIPNVFYIKCKDLEGNAMVELNEYEFILNGAESLNVEITSPTAGEIVEGCASRPVEVEVITSGGMNEGNANCEYSINGGTNWYDFSPTGTTEHQAEVIFTNSGGKIIDVRCSDGTLTNTESVSVTLNVDGTNPIITRFYRDGNTLTIETNEECNLCAYNSYPGSTSCIFNIGDDWVTAFSSNGRIHTTSIEEGKTYNIKCRDVCDNVMGDSECVTIKPSDF